ncbi:MAG: dockerin type I repeat-containing protein [Planctomycetota bacterium]
MLIDDFTSGELFLPLQEGLRFDSFSQTADMGPIVFGEREWTGVWSAIQEEGQSATFSVDTSDGVFRVETADDPFTYYTLSYSLFGERLFAQPPTPYDALAAGMDRVRLRFAGDSARVYHGVSFTSEAGGSTNSRTRSLGGRFVSLPGGIVEIPFDEYFVDTEFFTALTGFSLSSLRYQGDFEVDSIELAGPPQEGDLNRDGIVDAGDLAYLTAAYNGIRNNGEPITLPTFTNTYHTADMNGDGQINIVDYTQWRDLFDALLTDQAASVPEPTAVALLLTMTLLSARRSRRP